MQCNNEYEFVKTYSAFPFLNPTIPYLTNCFPFSFIVWLVPGMGGITFGFSAAQLGTPRNGVCPNTACISVPTYISLAIRQLGNFFSISAARRQFSFFFLDFAAVGQGGDHCGGHGCIGSPGEGLWTPLLTQRGEVGPDPLPPPWKLKGGQEIFRFCGQ